ncbi:hypothetical protein CEY00_Acc01158 [Actinidia chinensis var. chinensis]|uniref:Uncharacterized protein n=1 Tax=Actinidia chinensis var. chinensis TaxID=1590841 RepID=A0A2R6S2Y3_ACTCC|nr:hypothetical protein CEY00_Acc01158 [Actinidia chinensis var. chinensis]
MNLQQLAVICSSIPLLNCALSTLFLLSSSSDQNSMDAKSSSEIAMSKDDEDEDEDDVTTISNVVAQKHFRQVQHVRMA